MRDIARIFALLLHLCRLFILAYYKFTLSIVEQFGQSLSFEQNLLILHLVSQIIEVLVIQCCSRGESFDGRILQYIRNEINKQWIFGLQ